MRTVYNDDWYFDFMVKVFHKAGIKPDCYCEVLYCYSNRASERFCVRHKENQWAL